MEITFIVYCNFEFELSTEVLDFGILKQGRKQFIMLKTVRAFEKVSGVSSSVFGENVHEIGIFQAYYLKHVNMNMTVIKYLILPRWQSSFVFDDLSHELI